MAGRLKHLALRKSRVYHAYLLISALLLIVLISLLANGHGIVQASPQLTRQAHLSPLFVVHTPNGEHQHTWLGDLVFGRSLHYQRFGNQVVVDGVLHVGDPARHVMGTFRYGGDWINASASEELPSETDPMETVEDFSDMSETRDFYAKVNAEGEVTFTSVDEQVGDALREKLLTTTYSSPEEAEEAATGLPAAEEGEITTEHAVGVCVHADNVISFGGGSRRHVTDFRYHTDTRHKTVTRHQKYVSGGGVGWQTTERFYYSASRRFCGCG